FDASFQMPGARPSMGDLMIETRTLQPGSASTALGDKARSMYLIPRQHLQWKASVRFYAGQPDENDPTQFVIPYEVIGVGRGEIRGEVTGNGLVALTMSGPLGLEDKLHRP